MAPGYSNLHDNGSVSAALPLLLSGMGHGNSIADRNMNIERTPQYASMHDMNPPYNQGNPSYGQFHSQLRLCASSLQAFADAQRAA